MRSFVLGGGANYGAQQVGALEVLFECGVQPDMVMGVSAWCAQCGVDGRAFYRMKRKTC